jgi:hypothetical protein
MTDATDATRRWQDEIRRTLPLHDGRDFEDGRRGFIAPAPSVTRADDGRAVWDLDSFGFGAQEEAPDTVNPQGQAPSWHLERPVRRRALPFRQGSADLGSPSDGHSAAHGGVSVPGSRSRAASEPSPAA